MAAAAAVKSHGTPLPRPGVPAAGPPPPPAVRKLGPRALAQVTGGPHHVPLAIRLGPGSVALAQAGLAETMPTAATDG